MTLVKLRASPPVARIEVDGNLDLILAYDLRRAVAAALREGCLQLFIDLSRVPSIDGVGADSLRTCAEHVAAMGGELTITALSGPLRGVLAPYRRSADEPGEDAATA